MSIDYGIYVGPYVRCMVASEPVTKLQITCLNATCANHGQSLRAAFCSLCGGKIGTLPHVEVGDAIDADDVRERIDERMTAPTGDTYWTWAQEQHVHIWLPNVRVPGRNGHLEPRTGWALTEITPRQAEAETAGLAVHFQKEIGLFHDIYGEDAVSLEWGVVQDYS